MKKLSFKIIVTVFMIVVGFIIVKWLLPNQETTESGTVTIQIYNEASELVYEGSRDFEEGMFLYDVLDTSFSLTCANQNYEPDQTCNYTFTGFAYQGKVILGISNEHFLVFTNWTNTFLAIEYYDQNTYVLAQKGPSHMALNDGDIIRISVRSVSA